MIKNLPLRSDLCRWPSFRRLRFTRLEINLRALNEAIETSLMHGLDMYKDVAATVVRRDEANTRAVGRRRRSQCARPQLRSARSQSQMDR